jgi:hypothetical protein
MRGEFVVLPSDDWFSSKITAIQFLGSNL